MKKAMIIIAGFLFGIFIICVTGCSSGFFGSLDDLRQKAEESSVPGVFKINPAIKPLPSAGSGAVLDSVSVVYVKGIKTDKWTLSKDESATWLTFSLKPDGSDAGPTASGSGASTPVYLMVTANTNAMARSANLYINGGAAAACTVVQDGVPGYKIVPDKISLSYTASGASPQSIAIANISGNNSDPWTISTNVTWLTFSINPNGSDAAAIESGSGGSTPVYLVVSANNTGIDRTANIRMNGNASSSCVVIQAGGPGVYTVSPASISAPKAAISGSPYSISVNYVKGNVTDNWTLSTNVDWIKFSENPNGGSAAATVSGNASTSPSTPVYLVTTAGTAGVTRTANILITTNGNTGSVCVVNDTLGTEANPFKINSMGDLHKIGTNTDGWTFDAHYLQTGNIDLASVSNWAPIGPTTVNCFTGVYDGGGKTIDNLSINTNSPYTGLFGYLAGGTVKNLRLENCNINNSGDYTGGIAGCNSNGLIQNCSVSGTVTGKATDGYTGGVVGYNFNGGVVQGCNTAATVTGYYAGGVAGFCRVSTVPGSTSGGTVQNCYATGDVTGYTAGGVVGENNGFCKTMYCYSTGKITSNNITATGASYAGGVVGESDYNSYVQFCYSTGNVTANNTGTGRTYAGGIVGINNGSGSDSDVEHCYATGNIKALNSNVSNETTVYAGGISGYTVNGGHVRYCYATGMVSTGSSGGSGDVYAGGIAGRNQQGMYFNTALNGGIALLTGNSVYIGRVVGFQDYLGNNSARNDMLVNGSSTVSPKGSNTVHGADVTVGTSTYSIVFSGWDSSYWTFTGSTILQTGVLLPTLKNMPAGTQNPRLPVAVSP